MPNPRRSTPQTSMTSHNLPSNSSSFPTQSPAARAPDAGVHVANNHVYPSIPTLQSLTLVQPTSTARPHLSAHPVSPTQPASIAEAPPTGRPGPQQHPNASSQPNLPAQLVLVPGRTTAQIQTPPAPRQKQTVIETLKRISRLSWWWEASAIVLSITCTCLIIAILVSMHDKPLTEWKLPIQPSSLIAVFSTIAKSALLVPVAECISQLKWIYFENPTRLSQLQTFDDASRGPWGSLMFLTQAHTTSMASIGALITLLALAFEPFAQQVIEFPSRNAVLTNLTGSVASSNAWSDADLEENEGQLIKASFNSGMLSQLGNRVSLLPDSFCPTSECQIPDFTSLATCASCESEDIQFGGNPDCTFRIEYFERNGESPAPGNLSFREYQELSREHISDSTLSLVEVNCTKERSGFPQFGTLIKAFFYGNDSTNMTLSDISIIIDSWRPSEKIFETTISFETPPTPRYHSCAVQSYNMTELDTIDRFSCLTMPPLFHRVEDLETFDGVKGRMTWCRLHFCAQHYKETTIKNGIMNSSVGGSTLLTVTESSTGDNVAVIGNDPTKFYIGNNSRQSLSSLLSNLTGSDPLTDSLIFPFMDRSDSAEPFFQAVAGVFTALIRSSQNGHVKNVTGKAFGSETYVRVRWQWFILPLSVVVMSTLFLVLTISQSWSRDHRFKSSVLATLFHGLEGWDGDDLKIDKGLGARKERVYALEKKARTMKVALKENNDGIFKFMKSG